LALALATGAVECALVSTCAWALSAWCTVQFSIVQEYSVLFPVRFLRVLEECAVCCQLLAGCRITSIHLASQQHFPRAHRAFPSQQIRKEIETAITLSLKT